jgi:hypothetical protein
VTALLEAAIVAFLAGLLAFVYGEKVHNPLVGNIMGFVTMGSIAILLVLLIIALVV